MMSELTSLFAKLALALWFMSLSFVYSALFWSYQMDDDISPVLAPKQKDAVPKEEPADNSPAKPMPPGSAKGTPSTSKSAKGKRKLNADDAKTSNGTPVKKVKTENVWCFFKYKSKTACYAVECV